MNAEPNDTPDSTPEVPVVNDDGSLTWGGKTYVLKKEPNLQPPLKSYGDGESVEVFKNGEWLKGHITSRDKVSGYLHVHTVRGPITVASSHGVRKTS